MINYCFNLLNPDWSIQISHVCKDIAGGSGDRNEKCCTVVAWCKSNGNSSIILTEHKRKDRFEHRAKEPDGSFSAGCKRWYKVDLKHLAVT